MPNLICLDDICVSHVGDGLSLVHPHKISSSGEILFGQGCETSVLVAVSIARYMSFIIASNELLDATVACNELRAPLWGTVAFSDTC